MIFGPDTSSVPTKVKVACLTALLIFLFQPGGIIVPSAKAGDALKSLAVLEQVEAGLVALAEQTLPSVVNISPYVPPSPSIAKQGSLKGSRATNAGAGVIIDGDKGYVVTNSHVVRKAEKVQVTLLDGTKIIGHVLGADEETDLAVVKIKHDKPLPSVVIGDSSKLKVGQIAIAIGNPYGLNDTLTMGIISGLNRENINISRYEDFIQTDASINPGNSGGPLMNIRGEVIGINTAIINYAQSIGFAIPANVVKHVVQQIINNGEVQRGWMGVGIDFIPDDLAKKAKVETDDGVVVNSVFENQPAFNAGIQVGDIITKIGGSPVSSPSGVIRLIGNISPGQAIQVDLLRNGESKRIMVTLVKRQDERTLTASVETRSPLKLGFDFEGVTDTLRKKYRLGPEKGIMVTQIRPGGPAQKSGMKVGDLVTALNGQAIEGDDDLKNILLKAGNEDPLFFLVLRNKETLRFTLK